MGFSDRRQHASQDFQAQVVFVAESVGTPLENPDLVVEALHETERDLVLRPAIGGNPVPVPFDHGRELFVGRLSMGIQKCTSYGIEKCTT